MVHSGQVLAVLHSPELSDRQLDFLKAVSQRELAERAAARARQLVEAGVIGSAEVQRRDAELAQAARKSPRRTTNSRCWECPSRRWSGWSIHGR